MVFSSLVFLYFFLPLTLLLYYAAPKRLRNAVLLLMSLFFYGWGEPKWIVVMGGTVLVNFACAVWLGKRRGRTAECGKQASDGRGKQASDEHRELRIGDYVKPIKTGKGAVILSAVVSLGLLAYFKYAGFLTDNIPFLENLGIPEVALPIGISFYTFQAMSCTIDVYRGDAKAPDSLIKYATYVTLFPQLIAGPIVRYRQIADQLSERKETLEQFAAGAATFVCGLCKKVLFANQFGALWDGVQAMPQPPALTALFGLCCFTLQIYFDFSGYSDMAIGLGRMFGFSLPVNFNYPYISRSITEFWRRWHISLGLWFREYVYIPLGGNRVGRAKLLRNIFVVWCLTGLWHGASWNFVLWGLYYGVILLIEKIVLKERLARLPAGLQHLYALVLIVLGWALFSFTDMASLKAFMESLFGLHGLADRWLGYQLLSCAPLLAAGVIGATPLPRKVWARITGANTRTAYLVPAAVLFGLLLCTAFLVNASYNPFLYFRF